MNKDIIKVVAAILAAPVLANDKVTPIEHSILQHGPEEDKQKVRRQQRHRVAAALWGVTDTAELLCEFLDTPSEERTELYKTFVGEPESAT